MRHLYSFWGATAGRRTPNELLHSRRLRRNVSHNCSTKSNGPAVRSIRKENSLQWMFSTASLSCPMKTTVNRVDDGPLITNCPARERINEFHIMEINAYSGHLRLPCTSTIRRSVNRSGAADSPTKTIVNKRSRREPDRSCGGLRQTRLIPGVTTIRSLNDCCACAHNPTSIFIDEYSA